jgi:hypothetical protein
MHISSPPATHTQMLSRALGDDLVCPGTGKIDRSADGVRSWGDDVSGREGEEPPDHWARRILSPLHFRNVYKIKPLKVSDNYIYHLL